MIKKLPLVILLIVFSAKSQDINYEVSVNAQGLVYSQEESPFWLHTNQRGRIDEETNFSSWITAIGTYNFWEAGVLRAGVGVLYHDGYSGKAKLDEYFIQYREDWFEAFAGRMQREELYSGISATNQNLLWSLNSRPLPGLGIRTTHPVMVWPRAGLGFMASWEEYFSEEKERYIQKPRIHHKSFHLVFTGLRNLELSAGVNHYVQWAGKSPEHGELPSGLSDYIKVISGGSIGGDGFIGESEINGLGNHLGGYEAKLKTSFSHYDLTLIYNTMFEDMSGIKLRNTPDGRYGIYIEDMEKEKWVQAFIYEYYFTRNQSKNYPTTDGKDNYFNNHLYKSGWTYENRVIGLPFIVPRETGLGIAHNNIVAHHVGLTGMAFYDYPYKFLGTYRANYGVKSGTSKPVERIISTYLDVNVWREFVNLSVQFGADLHSTEPSNVGVGLKVQKNFF